jgi:hypothetical protein
MPIQYAPIYDAISMFGGAYVLPPDWSWLQVDADCRLLGDPVAAWTSLTEQFPAEDLLASGVAVRTDGGLVINPVLTPDDPGFIVLRKANGVAFDIATAAGCVSGSPPILKMLHDRVTKRSIAASSRRLLYATFSMVDTVLLRCLRVAVTPAVRLQSLHLRHLQRLLTLVGGSATGDIPKQDVTLPNDEEEDHLTSHAGRPEGEPAKFSLAIVAGSISALTADVPAALRPVAHHLASAERHLGFSWPGIQVWHPTPQDLHNLQYRQRLRSAAALRRFLVMHPGKYSLHAFEQPGPPVTPTPTLGETYFALLKRQQARQKDPLNFADIVHDPQAARQPYDTFVDQHFVRPLVEMALASADPEERVLYMEMAGLSRLHHRVMPAIFDMQGRSAREIQDNEGQFLPREAFRQLDHLSGRLQKLIVQHKATQRTRRGRR